MFFYNDRQLFNRCGSNFSRYFNNLRWYSGFNSIGVNVICLDYIIRINNSSFNTINFFS